MSMSRNSTELNGALPQGDRSPRSPRRSSIARRTVANQIHRVFRKTTVLPPLPVLDEPKTREEAEAAAAAELAKAAAPLSTLVPDLLIPPQKAMVRGWSCEDDHFEVRVWTSSPLKRSPELLTEPKPAVVQDQTRWMQHLDMLKRSFEHLEEAHEESIWQMSLGAVVWGWSVIQVWVMGVSILYFLSLPLVCILASMLSPWVRAKYVDRTEVLCRFTATLLLGYLLRPSRMDAMLSARMQAPMGTLGELEVEHGDHGQIISASGSVPLTKDAEGSPTGEAGEWLLALKVLSGHS
eukprot:s1849_g2.t1